mmetsp:Transcript_45559/g.138455  ORF Transcript_45559/g.138455 Transcript_45559/m.138455 type:complete len:238 (-) Transcript_45559:2-715(-)
MDAPVVLPTSRAVVILQQSSSSSVDSTVAAVTVPPHDRLAPLPRATPQAPLSFALLTSLFKRGAVLRLKVRRGCRRRSSVAYLPRLLEGLPAIGFVAAARTDPAPLFPPPMCSRIRRRREQPAHLVATITIILSLGVAVADVVSGGWRLPIFFVNAVACVIAAGPALDVPSLKIGSHLLVVGGHSGCCGIACWLRLRLLFRLVPQPAAPPAEDAPSAASALARAFSNPCAVHLLVRT